MQSPARTGRRAAWPLVLLGVFGVGLVVLGIGGVGSDTPAPTSGPTTSTAETASSTSLVEIDESKVALATTMWLNQVGLDQTDVTIWTERLRQACTQGVWDDDVALALAKQFVDQDQALSLRDPSLGEATATEAATSLWIMAVQACRDEFPPGAIEGGPPFWDQN